MFGSGPTGLDLAQLLRMNGGCHVVFAAPNGLKMELAKKLGAGDVYVELSRKDPSSQFEKLKKGNPYDKFVSCPVITATVCEAAPGSSTLEIIKILWL